MIESEKLHDIDIIYRKYVSAIFIIPEKTYGKIFILPLQRERELKIGIEVMTWFVWKLGRSFTWRERIFADVIPPHTSSILTNRLEELPLFAHASLF